MKRDDGINRCYRLGTVGFADDNPNRVVVSRGRYAGRWRVFEGRRLITVEGSFEHAINVADVESDPNLS